MNKKTSEIRELIWDRAKILEKKKNYSLVEQLQLCVFNWTRTKRVDKTKKPSEIREPIWARAKIPNEKDETPCVHRTRCRFPIFIRIFDALSIMINDEVQESWSTHGNG